MYLEPTKDDGDRPPWALSCLGRLQDRCKRGRVRGPLDEDCTHACLPACYIGLAHENVLGRFSALLSLLLLLLLLCLSSVRACVCVNRT